MMLNTSTGVLNLIPNIPDAPIAKASSLFSAHVELYCVGMDNELLHAHLVDNREKFHQFHQSTYTEVDSKILWQN